MDAERPVRVVLWEVVVVGLRRGQCAGGGHQTLWEIDSQEMQGLSNIC